jgi:hypothetical protein
MVFGMYENAYFLLKCAAVWISMAHYVAARNHPSIRILYGI